jgi:REP element-mobilizing transposase RayT
MVMEASLRANGWTIDLRAVVVMPDHAHMIFTPLVDIERSEVFSLARITKAIKSTSAHLINQQLGRNGCVWQEESFDRVLRVSEKLDEKIAYILDNPVRQGLASSPEQYRWLWVAPTTEPSFARLGK